MRQGPNPKRGRGRGSARKAPNHRSQNYDSNGPNVRVRGNAFQVQEKYLALARDAAASGDRVAAENYYQHAEHYLRIINAANAQAEARKESQQSGNGEDHPQDGQDRPRRGRNGGGNAEEGDDQAAEQSAQDDSGGGDEQKPARARRGNGRGRSKKAEAQSEDDQDSPVGASGDDEDGSAVQA